MLDSVCMEPVPQRCEQFCTAAAAPDSALNTNFQQFGFVPGMAGAAPADNRFTSNGHQRQYVRPIQLFCNRAGRPAGCLAAFQAENGFEIIPLEFPDKDLLRPSILQL